MIRLQRIGKKKKPVYRLVISEKHKDTQAASLEILGQYNPTGDPKMAKLKKERIEHWLAHGAQCSPTVHNLLINEGIINAEKEKVVKLTKKRRAKIGKKKEEKSKEAEATHSAKEVPEEPVGEEKDRVDETSGEEASHETGDKSQTSDEKKVESVESLPQNPVKENEDEEEKEEKTSIETEAQKE